MPQRRFPILHNPALAIASIQTNHMARTLFLLLVLLNLMAFAWIFLKGDERIDAGREPQRAKSELAAAKVRLLTATDSAAQICRAYAGATVAEAREIVTTWSEKLPAAQIALIPAMPPPVFDMVMPGLASRAAAEIKLAQLKNLGISEGVQIKAENDNKFSVLMASFKERSAAEDALKNAATKGVRSAVIIERPLPSTIEVRGVEAVLKPLEALVAVHKGLAPVACKATGNPS